MITDRTLGGQPGRRQLNPLPSSTRTKRSNPTDSLSVPHFVVGALLGFASRKNRTEHIVHCCHDPLV